MSKRRDRTALDIEVVFKFDTLIRSLPTRSAAARLEPGALVGAANGVSEYQSAWSRLSLE